MKTKKTIFILFIILVIIQLIAPLKMIYNQENILKKGKPYKFLTQPIDPSDPFRGKYIRLNYKIRSYKTLDSIWSRNDKIYVYLKDSLGYAKIDTVCKQKINTKKDYVIAKVKWYSTYNKKLSFNLPFNRFYMEESKAKPAEDLVRKNRRDTINTNTTYALVYLDEDSYVLDNVFVNNVAIKEVIQNQKNK